MRGLIRLTLLAVAGIVFVPVAASAQASITGVVRDASGAVLPGATVEASSPALIEKVRSVVTDSTGQYRIVDLRPGVYTVTFALTSFSTVKREGIELTGSFTATINAELRVGGIEETITVSGETPVVDVQSTQQQRVLKMEVLDAIPTGRSHLNVATLIPGTVSSQIDAGGTNTLRITNLSIHGGRTVDTRVLIDGSSIGNTSGAGQFTNFVPDLGSTQEVTLDYGAASAEVANGGLQLNLIPREGGNAFKGMFFGTGANSSFQGSNYSQALKDAGLRAPDSLYHAHDVNGSGGGPILRDKLWFYSSARTQANETYVAGMFENKNAGDLTKWTYDPDLSKQAIFSITQSSVNTRLTWQVSPRNKLGLFWDEQTRNWDNITSLFAPEAATRYQFPKARIMTASWSSPLTSRLLLDVRALQRGEAFRDYLQPEGSVYRKAIAVQEQSGIIPGMWYRGPGVGSGVNQPNYYIFMKVFAFNAAISYVTGAHAFKAGFSDRMGNRDNYAYDNDYSVVYRFNNAIPNQIWQRATPFMRAEDLNHDGGAFVQDKWTLGRVTLNGGLRFDHLDFGFPEQHEGPGPLVPDRNITFARVPTWVNFKDVSPRVGVVYDLRGDGKTAVKASVGRYVIAQGSSLNPYSDLGNPFLRLSTLVTRAWDDRRGLGIDGDYVPQCNLLDPLVNGECGTVSDIRFGQAQAAPSTTFDPATLTGWGVAPYNWEFSASVQHELMPRVGFNVGYFRRIYGNFTVIDNRAVAATDYTKFSIVAPSDSRLPNGGGYTVDNLYDLNPNKVGQVDQYFTFADNFGKQIEHWNGLDATVNARLQGGVVIQGGVSTGRTALDVCDLRTPLPELTVAAPFVINPTTPACALTSNFITQVKVLGTYDIPKVDVRVAATFQSLPGPLVRAIYNAPNAAVQPSLGRQLSAGAANVPVDLVDQGTQYNEQSNQLDMRFAKIFKVGRTRSTLNLDLYNALNANPVLNQNNTYGNAWLTPLAILNARLFKISVQFDF